MGRKCRVRWDRTMRGGQGYWRLIEAGDTLIVRQLHNGMIAWRFATTPAATPLTRHNERAQ